MAPKKIILYGEPQIKNLKEKELKNYLEEKISLPVELRKEFFLYWLRKLPPQEKEKKINVIAHRLSRIRVKDPFSPVNISFEPFQVEINYERRNLLASQNKKAGIIYEGEMFVSILRSLISPTELDLRHLHIIFTNQLLATWGGGRYHLRAIVCSIPSVISISGLVEGVAKPREFYLLKREYINFGRREMVEELKEKYRKEILNREDERMTDVVKGYLMQAVFYYLTGEPFCNDPNCRAYNAHWQKELLQAQLYSDYEFCSYHERILNRIRKQIKIEKE